MQTYCPRERLSWSYRGGALLCDLLDDISAVREQRTADGFIMESLWSMVGIGRKRVGKVGNKRADTGRYSLIVLVSSVKVEFL